MTGSLWLSARIAAASIIAKDLRPVVDVVRLGSDLNAGVAFYGRQAGADDVPKISAPLLLHYAGNDQGVNAGIAAYEAALKANKKKYTLYMYDGKQHGFHNDTTPRYDEAAAKLAWSRTLDFFNKHLR